MTGITPLSPAAHGALRYNRHAAGATRRIIRIGLFEIAFAAADMPLLADAGSLSALRAALEAGGLVGMLPDQRPAAGPIGMPIDLGQDRRAGRVDDHGCPRRCDHAAALGAERQSKCARSSRLGSRARLRTISATLYVFDII